MPPIIGVGIAKLHNELKAPIDRTISVLERINAPPHNQRMA